MRDPRDRLGAQADPRHAVRRPRDRHRGRVGARRAARPIAVAGAGASGAEIASAYGRLGTEVLLFEALDRVLRPRTRTSPRSSAAGSQAEHDDPHRHDGRERPGGRRQGVVQLRRQTAEVEWFIIAAGRGPDVEGLGLEEAGVKLDDNGLIDVDGALRTSLKGVYAIGDLVQGPALAHKASDEGIIAVEDAAGLETHPIEYIDIPRATFCTPNVGSFGLTEEQAREQGLDVVDRQGPVRRGRRRHRLRRPQRDDQDRRRQEVRRDGGRAHRRLALDRADPGARQRQGARGRLPRGRADHPRAPDAVRGDHGGRAGRRRLADPRLSRAGAPREQPRFYFDLASPVAYLAAERVDPRARRGAGVGAGELAGARATSGRSGAPRRSRRTARTSSARRRRRACRRCAGPSRSRPTAEWAMLVATYAKQIGRAVAFSLAAFRQAFAGGRDLGERDNVLIAAAACEMHPLAVDEGRRPARHARAARRPRPPRRARPACATCPPSVTAAGDVIEGARHEGQPRVRADRPPRRPRACAAALGRTSSTTSRWSRSTPARSCCSGTPRRSRPAASRARSSRPRAARGRGVPRALAAVRRSVSLSGRPLTAHREWRGARTGSHDRCRSLGTAARRLGSLRTAADDHGGRRAAPWLDRSASCTAPSARRGQRGRAQRRERSCAGLQTAAARSAASA